MKNSGRWRIGALASAVALLGSLASLEAHALALGKITVQSALGEPLRAEVDIIDINAEEVSSLKARVASPEAFKAAGLEYNAAIAAGLDVKLQRRADGRAYLRLTSQRAVTEPFVDLILEANSSSGRLSRDYTMLLDPPNLRPAVKPIEPNATMLPPSATPSAPAPATPSVNRAVTAATTRVPSAPAPVAAAASARQHTVKSGDTAGKIAAQNKPANVSLDQMLVALLRSNPDAFIGGNINRIKSGVVLDMPGAQAATAVSPAEARQTIVAQSKDFNSFRRKLARSVPTTLADNADRQATGKVQAKVEERAPAGETPDKLTLSKGAVKGKSVASNEDKIAKEKAAKADSSRIAELSKNIADLNKLNAVPSKAPAVVSAASPTNTASQPSVGLPVPLPNPVQITPPVLMASAASTGNGTADTASTAMPAVSAASPTPPAAPTSPAPQVTVSAASAAAPAAVAASAAAKIQPPAPVAPAPEASFIDELLENPLVLPGAGLLLALLGGLGFYRYRQNKQQKGQVDSSFLEDRLQPDSFFGASGGQRVDTRESSVSGSSIAAYTPSQLDAAGDVDPVAEADVYLAYGRDLQAEEILKEALRTHPARVAIHAKLLEIYAKRRDSKAFEGVAIDAFKLTQGYGPEWAHIAESGRSLDPSNPMYQAAGQPAGNIPATEAPIGATLVAPMVMGAAAMLPQSQAVDLDLDLDLSGPLDETSKESEVSAPILATSTYSLPLAESTAPQASLHDLDFDLDDGLDFTPASATLPVTASLKSPAVPHQSDSSDIDFLDDGIDFTPEPHTAPLPISKQETVTHDDSGMLEFDMNSLSLDLGRSTVAPVESGTGELHDPLEIKFLLAEEFRALGDAEGARSLADEVLDKSHGPLKAKAQAFLNTLS